MHDIAGIPYTSAAFDEHGACLEAPSIAAQTRQLIVVSHGWNNNRAEAEALYRTLFTHFAALHPGGGAGFAIVGVIWPSKTFDFAAAGPVEAGAVAAASIGDDDKAGGREAIAAAFAQFEAVFGDGAKRAQLAPLRALLPTIDQPAAQARFVVLLRALVQASEGSGDVDGADYFFGAPDPREVFAKAQQASSEVVAFAPGTAVQAAGIGGAISSAFSGVANAVGALLNITTYYEMKLRAGTVGEHGLAPLLDQLAAAANIERVHLVGHSFGARLVTTAAMRSTTPKLHSLSLLQAAFSHNAFSPAGFFRKVVSRQRLNGPIIVTHTHNDLAVGKAYAIASRISGDATSGLGDADDVFGGLGRNGAQHMEASEVSHVARELLEAGQAYALAPRLLHNLESSAYISGHGDVGGRQVAWALSQVFDTA